MTRNLPLLFIAFISICYQSSAQDRVFTHTYQTNVLPLGVKELEYWMTVRSGKDNYYNAIDQRFEMELGLGKKVQTAFYFNVSNVNEGTENGIVRTTKTGFSNEWKLKLSDPVANKIGSGLYAEIGFDGQEIELEGKVLLDKKIGKNLVAFNGVMEYEVEYEVKDGETESETETPFELDFAYMHFLGTHAGIGVEVRNHNVISEDLGWENSAWYAGPTFHFNGSGWFINVNVMPQLFNGRKEEGSTEKLDFVDHEKVEGRILLSFTL